MKNLLMNFKIIMSSCVFALRAFAATEAIESAFAIAHNVSAPILAVQQLIDCSKTNHGCEGGDLCVALDYVQKVWQSDLGLFVLVQSKAGFRWGQQLN